MMDGIEKITGRISADMDREIESILAAARSEAEAISAACEAQAQKEHDEIVSRGRKAADERVERLESVSALEGRKLLLAAKQEMLEQAFNQALIDLTNLSDEKYTALLASLAVKSARSGREEIILNETDRERCGRQVVSLANEILAKQVAPKLPDELSDTKTGAFISKVVTGASAILKGTGMLTLSEETRPILGGLILSDGDVEVNCTFETLVRLRREDMAADVARVMFA